MITVTPDPVAVQVGPVAVPWYGLGYAASLAVGAWVAQREARRRGLDPRHVTEGLLLCVVAALIGARLYHVIDQWALYSRDPLRIVLPPYSGLGLYGGVAGGLFGLFLYTRRKGMPFLRWADACVPSFLLGQAIARWGNFANQELYGPPTTLPWGIAIDCEHRVAAYSCATHPFATTGFHPLFFYESVLSLAGAVAALWLGRRFLDRLRDGDFVAFWFVWYGAVRTLLEPLRGGYNWTFFGIPVAILISVGAIVGGLLFLLWRHRGPGARAPATRDPDTDDGAAAGVPAKLLPGQPGAGAAVALDEPPERA